MRNILLDQLISPLVPKLHVLLGPEQLEPRNTLIVKTHTNTDLQAFTESTGILELKIKCNIYVIFKVYFPHDMHILVPVFPSMHLTKMGARRDDDVSDVENMYSFQVQPFIITFLFSYAFYR